MFRLVNKMLLGIEYDIQFTLLLVHFCKNCKIEQKKTYNFLFLDWFFFRFFFLFRSNCYHTNNFNHLNGRTHNINITILLEKLLLYYCLFIFIIEFTCFSTYKFPLTPSLSLLIDNEYIQIVQSIISMYTQFP